MQLLRRKILLAFIALAAFFSVLETVQRIRHPQAGFTYSFNSLGFRGVEFSPRKLPGTVRVFMVGGSTTFGTPCAAEDSFPYLTEKILRDKLPAVRVEIINAGKPFITSYNEVERIKECLPYEPDIVTVMTGYNDASTVYSDFVKISENGNLTFVPWHIKLDRFLMAISVFYTTFREKIALTLHGTPEGAYKKVMSPPEEGAMDKEAWFGHYPGHIRKNLDIMAAMAADHGFKLVFVRAPLSARKSRLHPLYKKAYMRLMEEMSDAISRHRIPCVDLDPVFPETNQGQTIHHDNIHFTREGNAIIARRISDFFLQHKAHYFPAGD